MSVDWFRSWHGAPTDPKWLVIAKRANVRPIDVSGFAWALLDHASQAENRGFVADFDFETYSALMGVEETESRSIYAAMEAKEIIVSGRIAKWEKRQPRREDSSAERMAKSRRRAEIEPSLPLEQPPERPPAAAPSSAPESTAAEPDDAEPEPVALPEPIAITAQAIELADKIAVIAGHDVKFVPPTWCGAATRVEMWFARGWSRPLILESVRAQMIRKRDGPPDTIRYFEKGIARAHASQDAPLPTVKPYEQETIHAGSGGGGNSGGFHRLAHALAQGEEGDHAPGHGHAARLRLVDGSGHP